MHTCRTPLFVLALILLAFPIDTAGAEIAVTCKGKPVRVSLELHYRWNGDGGLGTVRVPELTLGRDLENCTLESLYRKLLTVPGIVLRHSTGSRANTAMTQPSGEKKWHVVNDFNAVILKNGMRIWITLFNSPSNNPLRKKAEVESRWSPMRGMD